MNRSRYILAIILVSLTGYISLSYEILWIRLYSFLSGSRAWAFGALPVAILSVWLWARY